MGTLAGHTGGKSLLLAIYARSVPVGLRGLFTLAGLQWCNAVRRRRQLAKHLAQCGQQVLGRVTRIESSSLCYEFTAPSGEVASGRSLGPTPKGLHQGDAVDVLVDPGVPERNLLVGE